MRLDVSVDVDLGDVYSEMDHLGKSDMLELLERDGYTKEEPEDPYYIPQSNIMDLEWVENMKKLFHSRLRLSQEDEDALLKIINKL